MESFLVQKCGDYHFRTYSLQLTVSPQDIKGQLFQKPGSQKKSEEDIKREEARPNEPCKP